MPITSDLTWNEKYLLSSSSSFASCQVQNNSVAHFNRSPSPFSTTHSFAPLIKHTHTIDRTHICPKTIVNGCPSPSPHRIIISSVAQYNLWFMWHWLCILSCLQNVLNYIATRISALTNMNKVHVGWWLVGCCGGILPAASERTPLWR